MPKSSDFGSYHTVPPPDLLYTELETSSRRRFWELRLTDEIYASLYSQVADVVALEANLEDAHMGRLMATL